MECCCAMRRSVAFVPTNVVCVCVCVFLLQDMFLLGDPGPHLRAMALHFAAAMGREVLPRAS